MVYNTFVSNTFLDLGMAASFCYTGPRHTACSDFLVIFLAARNWSKAFYGLTSNVYVNFWSDFFALFFYRNIFSR